MLISLNYILRFVMEVATLLVAGYWMYHSQDGWRKYVLMFGIPIVMAVLWGVFAVSGDPSRSGKTVAETPGIIRLIMELVFFAIAPIALYRTGHNHWAAIFLALIVIHYLVDFQRVLWLLKR